MPMPSVVPCASSSPHLNQTPRPLPLHSRPQRPDFPIGSARLHGNSIRARPTAKGNRYIRARANIRTESDGIQSSSKEEEKTTVDTGGGNNSFSAARLIAFLCPLLKLFGGGDPSQQRNEILEVATSSLSSVARLAWGSSSLAGTSEKKISADNPLPLVQLYEFEACPFCRRVREVMTELDLSVEIYPCPKGSLRHREMVRTIGGKEKFPFLVDPNSCVSMYESGDIVKYLFQQYGRGGELTFGLLESTLLTGWMPTLLRAGRGMTLWQKARKDPPPEKLVLFSYENNPYARIVREALCELGLPYILHNAGKGSSKHELLFRISGANEVPYLVDPNTATQMGNYKRILSYLFETYSSRN